MAIHRTEHITGKAFRTAATYECSFETSTVGTEIMEMGSGGGGKPS